MDNMQARRPRPRPSRAIPPTEMEVKTDVEDMTPTPEQTRRMQEIVNEERRNREMQRAYDMAPYESMGTRPPKRFAKGGSASARADGIAQRGKTRGKFV